MDLLKNKRLNDLNQKPDTTQYEVLFYVEKDQLQLYETLKLDSPPQLPDEGDYISFDFIVDENEEEIFRQDGLIEQSNIGTDRKYTELQSPQLEIKEIKTTYHKHMTEKNENITTIKKMVILHPPFDD